MRNLTAIRPLFLMTVFMAMLGMVIFTNFGAETVSAKNEKSVFTIDTKALVQSTTLVISQAYGGGGGTTGTYMHDYVEIKNISATPQSLNGLSLYYGSATGQFASSGTNAIALPNISLNPGQYFLVQTSTAGTGGVALPVTADLTTTNLSMSGTNGKVALVNGLTQNSCGATATPCTLPNAAIIDLVSWGTANNAEGGAATNGGSALTATQGNVRKADGCTDTDNNNADFEIVTNPVPRNSATAPASCGGGSSGQGYLDFDGDGKTDITVVRNIGAGGSGATDQIRWFTLQSGNGQTTATDWGVSNDYFVPADYDGDGKTDIAVWRAVSTGQPSNNAHFYILESAGNTLRVEDFGQSNDAPTVVADYDGDGKADVAVYRSGANSGDQSVWYYRGSLNNPSGHISAVNWGLNGDFPAPGDYDGDGKNDFVVQRNNGGGQARFWLLQTTAGFESIVFGTPTDVIVPNDFDGDGKTDIAVVRGINGNLNWFVRPSSTGVVSGGPTAIFGSSATDYRTVGDYDGDGKSDIAVWRPSTVAGESAFWVLGSSAGIYSVPFGQNGDFPVATFRSF